MDFRNLDRLFSIFVRTKADWTCALCGRQLEDRPEELHCSHYHSRSHKAVRFDPDNCDALCWECHYIFDTHPAEHEKWKRAQLGEQRFTALELRARSIVKLDLRQVRIFIKDLHRAA